MKKIEIVVIGDVDCDKHNSPWGYVVVHTPKKKKTTKRKIFFHSLTEWQDFYKIWKDLEAPWQMQYVTIEHARRGFWYAL